MTEGGTAPGTPSRDLPSLGVLVSVYHRTRYYRDALNSVAQQGGELPEVQVAIVRGPNVEIDVPSGLKARGWACTVVASDEPGEGKFLSDGLRALDTELILPLDDDDLWDPGRLATIARRFAERPEVDYYHNGQRFVDDTGAPISASRAYRRLRRYSGVPAGGWRVLPPERLQRSPRLPARWGSAFNNSSMAVRRRLLEGVGDDLGRAGWLFDLFVFYVALTAGSTLLFDTAPLTAYRIHETNRSRGERATAGTGLGSARTARDGRLATLDVIRSMVGQSNSPWLRAWVDHDRAYFELLEGLRNGEVDRMATARRIARLARHGAYGDPVMNVVLGLAAAGQLVAPSAARRAYWGG